MNTSSEGSSERRRFVRYTLKVNADLVFANQMTEHAEVDNISTGGMFLKLDYDIPGNLRDKTIHAAIHAICGGKDITIESDCSIVRVEPNGVALFFASIDSANRTLLRDLIGELNNLMRDSRM